MDAAVFGLIVADLIAEPMDLRNPPAPGGLHVANSITMTTGGNVPNTGIAMAKLGMRVAAAGLVGEDVLGQAVVEKMRSAGLDVSAVFVDGRAQTSASIVAVEPGGERVFFHTPGVTKLLDAGVFRKCVSTFKKCAFVQVGYFGLLPVLTPDLAEVLGELKREAPNVKVALDTVNPPGEAGMLWPILREVDVFCPSRTEARALTGENEPGKMAGVFRKHMRGGLVGIKLDAEGCFLDDGREQVFVPAYKIDVVDTTGAGDTWFGGLLTAMRKGMSLKEAGKFANRAAADCCTAIGASAGVRSFDETFARL
ncbi:MAG TPA: carbohydrate kinase family protein [Tepidisphaeraceae bacterium]|jgi:sugar/nucleoside kinase (ribokinase family)|nr:carbohydrate kinase family protein [Tepidisphaeraceae bacterium]